MLNIISGKFRGTKLKNISSKEKLFEIRPTSSKIRAAVFNSCQFYLEGSSFLDLFAGCGAMGLEAISRGSSLAVFVDISKDSCKIIKDNIKKLELYDDTLVFCLDVFDAIDRLHHKFDFVYIDPPYDLYKKDKDLIAKILKKLKQKDLLNEDATIFIESPSSIKLEINEDGYSLEKSKKYGSSTISKVLKSC
jgi:16S rRNA (guanine966-N2)-methyltransferase